MGYCSMLEQLENELIKWLKKLEGFFEELRSRKVTSGFFTRRKMMEPHDERLVKLIALARKKLKHPTKGRMKIIARRERMKEIMRLKNQTNGVIT